MAGQEGFEWQTIFDLVIIVTRVWRIWLVLLRMLFVHLAVEKWKEVGLHQTNVSIGISMNQVYLGSPKTQKECLLLGALVWRLQNLLYITVNPVG